MKKVSVLIPFLNESKGIPILVSSLEDFYRSNKEAIHEFIFIDDGSSDDSFNQLNHQSSTFPFSIIKLSKNFGSHAALRAGIQYAKGELITFLYADLQDPLDLIIHLSKEVDNGFDVVWAQRKQTQSGVFSLIYSSLMRIFVNPNYPSQGFDVVMFNRKVRQELNKNVEANSSIFLQILELGFSQSTITYDKRARTTGKSKWTISKKIKLFVDSFVAFSYLPIRISSIMGILFFCLGILYAAYLIFRELIIGDLDSGWPALMSIILIGFGLTNISLGIIAEYLWRTLDSSRQRPVFIIDEIIEKNSNES